MCLIAKPLEMVSVDLSVVLSDVVDVVVAFTSPAETIIFNNVLMLYFNGIRENARVV